MKSSSKPDDQVQIGKILGAHGIHGAVRVRSYAESIECFTVPEGLTMTDTGGNRMPCEVLWARPHKNGICLALRGVTTRSQAGALTGYELWIPRTSLPPLDEDTHYWIDLIGMTVFTTDRQCLGQITEVIATGANDVYVVATPEGFPVKEILLPAIASVILEVDVAGRKMVVELPEGLI